MSCEEATDDMYVGDCGEDSVNQSEAYSGEMPQDDTETAGNEDQNDVAQSNEETPMEESTDAGEFFSVA